MWKLDSDGQVCEHVLLVQADKRQTGVVHHRGWVELPLGVGSLVGELGGVDEEGEAATLARSEDVRRHREPFGHVRERGVVADADTKVQVEVAHKVR